MRFPLAFMHIAKTAGSSVNDYFQRLYPQGRTQTFVEHLVYGGSSLGKIFESYDFVSGHLFFGHFHDLPRQIKRMTIIREPFSHLASHLRWIKHYNHDYMFDEMSALPREIRDLIQYVGRHNLGRPEELDHLLTNLPPYGIYLFNNLQCRYLIGDSAFMDSISLRDAEFACSHLEQFDYVFTLDDLPKKIPLVAHHCGLAAEKFVDYVNRSDGQDYPDIACSLTRDVMRKHVLADISLYNHAVQIENTLLSEICVDINGDAARKDGEKI